MITLCNLDVMHILKNAHVRTYLLEHVHIYKGVKRVGIGSIESIS